MDKQKSYCDLWLIVRLFCQISVKVTEGLWVSRVLCTLRFNCGTSVCENSSLSCLVCISLLPHQTNSWFFSVTVMWSVLQTLGDLFKGWALCLLHIGRPCGGWGLDLGQMTHPNSVLVQGIFVLILVLLLFQKQGSNLGLVVHCVLGVLLLVWMGFVPIWSGLKQNIVART